MAQSLKIAFWQAPIPFISILLSLTASASGLWWWQQQQAQTHPATTSPTTSPNISVENRISLGEEILLTGSTNPDKQAAVEAIAKQNHGAAIPLLKRSLAARRNDPESLIYLNNAEAATADKVLKIAVSVPIGKNPSVAEEMLRGVAQAQDEVNRQGGIKGAKLQVAIANDDNDIAIVPQIAQALVQDEDILAVVGHNSSNASVAAAPIYQLGGLVMISPTSTSTRLSGIGNYIFRTAPSNRFTADALATYAVQVAGKSRFLVCLDSSTEHGTSMKREFTTALVFSESGRIISMPCDFSDPQFNPEKIVNQALKKGAEGILLVPAVSASQSLDPAIAIARASQGRLLLLGSDSMYSNPILEKGGAAVEGMVMAVAWHPNAFPRNPYTANSQKLWGSEVNWRSATAYDATQAIIQGLKQSTNRDSLRHALTRPNFGAPSSIGSVRFLPTGDREGSTILIKIQAGGTSNTNYQFVPLPRKQEKG